MEEQMNLFDLIYQEYKIKKPIRLIELFGGIGSQAKALENLQAQGRIPMGFEHYKLVEFDKYPVKSYNAIHEANFEPMDITKIHATDLEIKERESYEYIMTYSFPCQDLSLAGKGKGMKKGSGTRSGLLWEVERLLNECGDNLPQILLMENVPMVIGEKNIDDFNSWRDFLASKGYTNTLQILNAKNYGIPQNRQRAFMISILGDTYYKFPNTIPLKLKLKDMLEDDVDEKYFLSKKMIDYITARMPTGDNKVTTGINIKNPEMDDTSGTITTTLNRPSDVFICDEDHYYDKEQGKMCVVDSYNKKITNPDIAGCIVAGQNRNQGSMVMYIKNATKKGYLEAREGDGVDISSRMGAHRGTVQKQSCQTLTCGGDNQGVVVAAAQRGREGEQQLEVSDREEANAITTAQKDSMVAIKRLGSYSPSGHKATSVVDSDGLAQTVMENHGQVTATNVGLRIRKLTPRECWRLMGFSDQDFNKASKVNSNAQLYKQAGNSIVVNVLMAIFDKLL